MAKIILAILTMFALWATTNAFAQTREAVRERCHIGGNADGSGGMWCDCIGGRNVGNCVPGTNGNSRR
jgi:hypothetical protein